MAYPLGFPSDKPLATVTHPTPIIWVLEMHNGEDSRLDEHFVSKALMPALDAIERHWREGWRTAQAQNDKEGGRGALILVGNRGQNKFFSNGLDYDNVIRDPNFQFNFFSHVMNPFYRRVLTFPIPTVAAINGYCYAAAMTLSLCCDYRVMTDGSNRRTCICMNEIHFGAGWPYSIAAITRTKVPDARVQRKIALEGHRFTPQEALDAGIVDFLVPGDTEAVITKAQQVGESMSNMTKAGAWGVIKRDLYRDLLEETARDVITTTPKAEDALAKARL